MLTYGETTSTSHLDHRSGRPLRDCFPHLFKKFTRIDRVTLVAVLRVRPRPAILGNSGAHGGRIWAESEGLGRGASLHSRSRWEPIVDVLQRRPPPDSKPLILEAVYAFSAVDDNTSYLSTYVTLFQGGGTRPLLPVTLRKRVFALLEMREPT